MTQRKGHLGYSRVTLSDVLEYLSSSTHSPSTFGNDLDRARFGTTSTSNPTEVKSAMEDRLLRMAPIIRCVEDLIGTDVIRFAPAIGNLKKFSETIGATEGSTVVAVLRRYRPWATSKPMQGMALVYEWMTTKDGRLKPADAEGEESVAQAFLVGKAKTARTVAARIVADAEIIISAWVDHWNRRGQREGN